MSIALAGSLFFSIDPGAARGRVTLYLVLTMAPFALISPLVGPAIDRAAGGRRWMVVLASGLRVIVAALMMRHINSLLLFPEAFAALVLGKAYHVAKSALVPTLVTHRRDLVEANSKLVVISGLAGLAAAVPGVLLFQIGPEWVLLLAVVAFGLATVAATRVPRTTVAAEPVDELERTELRGIGVLLAASAMGVVRAVVGFMTFLLAFWLKDEGAAAIWFGVLVGASLVGTFTGALLAPRLRRVTREENLLLAVILATTLMAAFTGAVGGRTAAGLLAFTVGIAASAGKLAFDAIVQRDAPDANQGRSFAKFETRFQLAWVAGALIPAVLPLNVLPVRAGFVVIAAVLAFAGFTYFTSLRAVARGERPLPNPSYAARHSMASAPGAADASPVEAAGAAVAALERRRRHRGGFRRSRSDAETCAARPSTTARVGRRRARELGAWLRSLLPPPGCSSAKRRHALRLASLADPNHRLIEPVVFDAGQRHVSPVEAARQALLVRR